MKRLLKSKKGQGTTEYIVIVGLIVIIAIAIMAKFHSKDGGALDTGVTNIATQIGTATGGAAAAGGGGGG